MKKLVALLLAACMTLVLFAGCNSTEEEGSETQDPNNTSTSSIDVALGAHITTLDHGINTETQNEYVLTHLYSGMFRKDEQGNVQKELCKDYTVSDDGLTYTFTLIDDAMWSDGTPLTAHDFEYAMLRALSYGVDNAYSIKEILDYLKGSKEYNQAAIEAGSDFDCTVEDHSYVGIKATDDKTLVIELEAPCTFLPSLMCNRAWVALPQDTPQHDSLWSLEPGYPTSGPYVLSEINSTEKAVLTKSETYFNKDAITMDSITFWCMPDQDAQAMNFESGELDVALSVTASAADKYKGTDNLGVIQDGTSYFIVMNSGETGPDYLKDVRVRRALALAIDKQAISDVLGSEYYQVLNGYVPHGAAGINGEFRDEADADGYTLTYDPETAKQLLAEAGYDESNPLKTVYKYSNNSIHGDVATMLQSFWAAVGVDVSFDSVESSVYYDQVDQGDFELCRYADSVSSHFSRLLTLWTTGGQVVPAVSDPVYDEMAENAIQLADPTEYLQALHEMEDYLVEENVYLIPLFEYLTPYLVADGIQGITLNGVWPFFGYCTIAAETAE